LALLSLDGSMNDCLLSRYGNQLINCNSIGRYHYENEVLTGKPDGFRLSNGRSDGSFQRVSLIRFRRLDQEPLQRQHDSTRTAAESRSHSHHRFQPRSSFVWSTNCFLRAVLGSRNRFPTSGLLTFFIMTIMSHNYQGSSVRWNTALIDRYTCTFGHTNHKYTYQDYDQCSSRQQFDSVYPEDLRTAFTKR
jgi:hypothetical protein